MPRDDCQNADFAGGLDGALVPSTCTEIPESHVQGPKPCAMVCIME